MSDLISRQDAIEELHRMYNAAEKWGREVSDDVIMARAESCMASIVEMKLRIEKLPSAKPEQQWIPCSERMPELDQEVLVYAIGKDDGFIGDAVTTIGYESKKQEVAHGEWIIDGMNEYELSYGCIGYEPIYRCSKCGLTTESYLRTEKPIMPEDADFPNYCPNCGAKMDGEVKDDG